MKLLKATLFYLLLFICPARAGIIDIYEKHGYNNIQYAYIVQFPFVHAMVEYLFKTDNGLLPQILNLVDSSITNTCTLDALINLENRLASDDTSFTKTIKWLRNGP